MTNASVYSLDGDAASWVLDLIQIRMAQGAPGRTPGRGNFAAAQERMSAYGEEVRQHITEEDAFGLRILRAYCQRQAIGGASQEQVERRAQNWVRGMSEHRDSSTSLSSLGTFAPTPFWLSRYAKYRSNAAPLLAAANHLPLPASGMTVDVPTIQLGMGAQEQAGENTSASGGYSPSVTYASAAVGTYTSGISVSQQVLDRVGPGIAYDEWHAAQAARQLASAEDTALAAQIVTGAQTVTRNSSATFGIGNFWQDVANGSQLILNAPPPAIRATDLFVGAGLLYGFMAQVSSTGQPAWEPQGNTVGGMNDGPLEAYSGYQVMGSNVWFDDNLGGPSSGYGYALLGDPDTLFALESDPVVDVYPEYNPAALEAWVNCRLYAAFSVLYPTGWCAIGGTFYPSSF